MTIDLQLADFASLSPLLILLGFSLILILMESFASQATKKYVFYVSLLALVLALFAAVTAPVSEDPLLTRWIRFDPLARFFTILFMLIGIGSVLLSNPFFKRFESTQGEYYFLLLAALFGLVLIGISADFLTLFLGLETLSIALYVLCGYMKKWEISHEAAVKYFLMGALASSFLLYGVALVYGAVGSTHFDALLPGYRSLSTTPDTALFLGGMALITLGLAFKAAIVPFHVWAPDVYAGASTPVTAFMAVGTKAGAFAAFARVFLEAVPNFDPLWNEGISLLIYPTLIYANFVALRQTQMRRFFAYSGIAHAGYMLMAMVAGTPEALSALLFYLIVYSFSTLGCFAVLTFLDRSGPGVMLDDLHGLFRRSPLLGGIFALCLLTLAGIPPTAGFFAKFYIFKVTFQAGYVGLVVVGLLTTILAAYYYLRIISVMFTESPNEEKKGFGLLHDWPAAVVCVVALSTILLLSFYPAPFMALIGI